MSRAKHADMIIAWANGEVIETNNVGSWREFVDPSYIFIPDCEYRIKPKEPEWWENIPEHGVLVKSKITANVFAITSYDGIPNPELYVPLTNEEIESFKR